MRATAIGFFALGLLLAAPQARARAPRYAVYNAGPADFDTARSLLRLYDLLSGSQNKAPRAGARDRSVAPPRRRAPGKGTAGPRLSARSRRAAGRPVSLAAPIVGRGLRRALVGLAQDEAFAMASAALRRGKVLFSTLKRARAVESFEKALALFDGHVAWKKARPGLLVALKYLLLCHHALGRRAAAGRISARLRELTQNRRPEGVPEGIWSAYPLAPLPLAPRRTVHVKAPPKARVFLDDQLVGPGPQRLAVGPGGHRLRVELEGHRIFFREIGPSTASMTVRVSLVPFGSDAFAEVRRELAKLRRAGDPWKTDPLLRLSRRLFIDHVLVCVLRGGSLKARWFSASLKRFASPVLSLPAPGGGSLKAPVLAAYRRMVAAERKRAKELAAARAPKRKKRQEVKLWKKWYFWVAAALVAGVVAAFAIKDSVTEEKVILRVTRP